MSRTLDLFLDCYLCQMVKVSVKKKIRSENFRAEIFRKVFEIFLLRTLVHSLVTLGGGEWYPTGEAVRQLLLVGLAVRDCGSWPSSLYYINFLDPPVYEEAKFTRHSAS